MVWFLTSDPQNATKRTWIGAGSPPINRNRKQKLTCKLTLSDSGFEDEFLMTPSPSSERTEGPLRLVRTETLSQLSWYRQYGDTGYIIQKEKEIHFHPGRSLARQPQLNAEARCKLVSWLIPVHKYLNLSFECCCLTINIMDRFLACTPVAADCFQLLGITALLLASKQVEVCSPRISHLLTLCCDAFTKDQLCNLECLILVRLNFQLFAPTMAFFLDCYTNLKTILLSDIRAVSARDNSCDEIRINHFSKLAHKLCELSLADYAFNKYPPSLTARCALQLASEIQEVAQEPLHTQNNRWDSFTFPTVSHCALDSNDFSNISLSEDVESREYSLIQECTNNLRLLSSLNQEALTML